MNTTVDWLDHAGRADAAPEAELHLLQDFVNTRDIERDDDQLGTPDQLRDWLVERGLVPRGTPADAAAHARTLAVREGIRALGHANNEGPMDAAAVATLNEALAGVPLRLALRPVAGEGEWRLLPAAGGIDAFLARVLAGVTGAMADGSWSRMKACRNDTCRWLFFDQSRNRSGTWCTMAICGSRMKARAYRARRREAADA